MVLLSYRKAFIVSKYTIHPLKLLLAPNASHFLSHYSYSLRYFSSSNSGSFMEVVKSVARQQQLEAHSKVAILADKKSYSYTGLITSALRISELLCNGYLNTTNPASKNNENSSVSIDGVSGHGLLDGARIGIVAKPSAEFVAGLLGTWFGGGVAVPLALSYPEAELLHVLNDSGISMILSTEDHRDLMQNISAKAAASFVLIPPVTSISSSAQLDAQDGQKDSNNGAKGVFGSLKDTEDGKPALIVYTSGTTGRPKGAVHTHKSISAQVKTLAEAWEYTSADQFLNCLPLHHVHGIFNALLAPLYAGATVEFLPKFSVSGIWQRWRESYPVNREKAEDSITVFTGVPTMYTRLLQGYESMNPDLQVASAYAAKQLRLMMCGSSALPIPVMQQWEAVTGHRLLERYGMTEFVMAISNPLRGVRKPGTVGKPFPGVETRIVTEDESGSDTTASGELCIRCPSLFKEYWNLPEVSKNSFTDDGFFKTGDAVTVDEDGYYIILGRTSADIMKVGGYKLSALEIESVLLAHPDIAECSVLGLPDKDYGEAVSAVIVLKAGVVRSKPAISLEELCAWTRDKLAPYKLPTRLFVWDSLPRNAMGKVNKKELKNLLATKDKPAQD